MIAVTCMVHAAQDQSDWWSIFQKVIPWLASGARMGRVALGQGLLRALRFSPVGVVPAMLHTNHRRYVVLSCSWQRIYMSLHFTRGKAKLSVATFRSGLGMITQNWPCIEPLVRGTSVWIHLSTAQVCPSACPQHKSVDPLVHQVIKFSWYISLHLLCLLHFTVDFRVGIGVCF